MRRLLFLPAILVIWIALAAPGFGGSGSGSSNSSGGWSSGGNYYDDSPNHYSSSRYSRNYDWEDAIFALGFLALASAGVLWGYFARRQRVLEIIVGVPTADQVVPALDRLLENADTYTPEGRGSALSQVIGYLESARVAGGVVHLSPLTSTPAQGASGLYANRMGHLGIRNASPYRDHVDGAALVGIIVTLPRLLKCEPGGKEALEGAYNSIRGTMPLALYVYYLPEDGKTLSIDEAEQLMRQLHGSRV